MGFVPKRSEVPPKLGTETGAKAGSPLVGTFWVPGPRAGEGRRARDGCPNTEVARLSYDQARALPDAVPNSPACLHPVTHDAAAARDRADRPAETTEPWNWDG
jgi:hypothetical protein